MKLFDKALAKEFNISIPDQEKVASENQKSSVEGFKTLVNNNIEVVKLAEVTGDNKEMRNLIDIILSKEKTAGVGNKKYSLDMKKFASAVMQRIDATNDANKRMVYTDSSASLIKLAYSSMWDEEVVAKVSPLKIATQMLINDISFLRGKDDLDYGFIVETPEKVKVANDLKKSILNERVLERIENEVDEEVADDLRTDFDTMYNALPDPYQQQINGIVEDEMGKVAFVDQLQKKYLSQTEKGISSLLTADKEPSFPTNSEIAKSMPKKTVAPKLNGFGKKAEKVTKMEKKDTSPYIREEAASIQQGEFPNKGIEFSWSREDLNKMFPPNESGSIFKSVEYDKNKSTLHEKDKSGDIVDKKVKTVYEMLEESDRFSKKKDKIASFMGNYSLDHMDDTDKKVRNAGILLGAAGQASRMPFPGPGNISEYGPSDFLTDQARETFQGISDTGLGIAGGIQGYNMVNSRNKLLKGLGAGAGALTGMGASSLLESLT